MGNKSFLDYIPFKVTRLIKQFNLEAEVEDFVNSRVKTLVFDKHSFDFCGSNHTGSCGDILPHIPHIIGWYGGELETFCCGIEGTIAEGSLFIIRETFRTGNASTPSYAAGFWFITS